MSQGRRLVSVIMLLVLSTVAVCAVVVHHSSGLPAAQNQEKKTPDYEQEASKLAKKIKAREEAYSGHWAIAEHNSSEILNSKEKVKRDKKGKKYNNEQALTVMPDAVVVVNTGHWAENLSPIPADQSNAVVLGKVTDAKAYLSPDKTGVYTEFTIQTEEVLKDDSSTVQVGDTVAAERRGGRVRSPSGIIQRYSFIGQDMPRVGQRYVLFLKRAEENFQIVTGYKLQGGRVEPLDGLPMFGIYADTDEQSFLSKVCSAVTVEKRARSNTTAPPVVHQAIRLNRKEVLNVTK